MDVICCYSSIIFKCEFFPGTIYGPEISHPIFQLPQRKLLNYLPKWAHNELTETDSYLLFCALLKSTDLLHFRSPIIRTRQSASIVANHMEALAKITQRINEVARAETFFPHYIIGNDTSDLSNVSYWIENWRDKYNEYKEGASRNSAHDLSKINRREMALERMIKNPHKPISEYANILADWAAVAADFPLSNTISRFNGQPMSISDYWKQIIIKCANDVGVWSINENDLLELKNHCHIHLSLGSIHSHALYKLLKRAEDKLQNFLGFGDLNAISSFKPVILDPASNIQDANTLSIIASAPDSEPKYESYPTKIAYLKAKGAWMLAQKYKNGS